jgi:CheY-like chemotaxis protein/DNA-binding CsgD family transcriptional regulator
MRILVVDDDEDSRVYLERALRSQKHDVVSVGNGAVALQKAYEWQPDLVISDILMPEMNGFELCRRMKTDERLRNIPFIFYTATFVDKEDEELAMQFGASRFLIKPMDNAEFFKIINEVIEEHAGNKLPVPDRPLVEMKDLCQLQPAALQRKLDKKVRELAKEHEALKVKARELEEANTALGVLLKRREQDHKEWIENVQANIEELIDPYLRKLDETRLNETQQAYVDELKLGLAEIGSPFINKLSHKYANLSPMQVQIANLIKAGKESKDIAKILGVSLNTVMVHRYHLRTKLGIRGNKVNLRSYLSSIDLQL